MKLSKTQLKKIEDRWYITDNYFGCGYLCVTKKRSTNFPFDKPVLEKMGFEMGDLSDEQIKRAIPEITAEGYREYTGKLRLQSEEFDINYNLKYKTFLSFDDVVINVDFYEFCKSFFEKDLYKIYYKDSLSAVIFTNPDWDIVVMPVRI